MAVVIMQKKFDMRLMRKVAFPGREKYLWQKKHFHFSAHKFVMKNACDKKIFQYFPGRFFIQLPGLFKKKECPEKKHIMQYESY